MSFHNEENFWFRMLFFLKLKFSQVGKNIYFFILSRSVINFFSEIVKKTVDNQNSEKINPHYLLKIALLYEHFYKH